MSDEMVGDLAASLGYVLKQAQSLLRARMDEVLRPLDLTTPQYACLELLGRTPGLSNSDLARGAFVTRQSMNLVVLRLQDRGLLTRPEAASRGRTLPTQLTEDGRGLLDLASKHVRAVEKHLFSVLSPAEQKRIVGDLTRCVQAAPDAAAG